MSKTGTVIKFFLAVSFIAAIIVAVLFLYITFFGKGLIEEYLSKIIGSDIKFKKVSVNFENRAVNFGGFTIENEIGFEKKIFNAETFTFRLNKLALDKERKIIFDEVIIDKAVLNIERSSDGKISLIMPVSGKDKKTISNDVSKNAGEEGFYSFVKTVRNISVKNSVVRFWDYSVSKDPFLIICENVGLEMSSDPDAAKENGYVPLKIMMKFEVPNKPYASGVVQLAVDMKVYKPFFETSYRFVGENVDIDHIKPYLDLYTPFIFNKGVFSISSKGDIISNNINNMTTIVFHTLRVNINPSKQDSEFLQTSVNKLIPYLTSSQGEITFDFIMKGPINSPAFGMGPRLKEAAGMAVMDEVGKYIQSIQ